jgi:hypothetical protein
VSGTSGSGRASGTEGADADGAAAPDDGGASAGGTLAAVRTGRYADLALFVAVLVGVAATTVHWAGLVVGGLLVGLVAPTVARALATALSFGLVVLVAFGGWLAWNGALAAQLAATPLLAATIAAAFGLPAVAALGVRAVSPG